MRIRFDDAAAARLVLAADDAAELLRGQGGHRREAAENAIDDFTGRYADLFADACGVEAEDRYRLVKVLYDLADQVRVAQRKAEEENERLRALDEWEERERRRRRERALVDAALPGAYLPGPEAYDPKPSEYRIHPPTVSAPYRAHERIRALGAGPLYLKRGAGIGNGSSGADPDLLRAYVSHAAALNSAAAMAMSRLRAAWSGFTAFYDWVPVEHASFIAGFDRYLAENLADARWIGHIADAFEQAGRGTLSDFGVTLAVSQDRPATLIGLLLGGSLTPEQVAAAWAALAAGSGADADALLRRYADALGSLDGMPALARVRANRYRASRLLDAVEAELERVRSGELSGGENYATYLSRELAYLRKVRSGDIQLYLYDRNSSRIIEMIGTPGPGTARTITYVPGTFANLNGFFSGGVQQVARYLVDNLPGTVAFVYKDGLFPGEQQRTIASPVLPHGVLEANDPDMARAAGRQLAAFATAMRADPLLSDAKQIGIGHSWGLANVTSSEVAGARYDTVLSLSGAGMLPEWKAASKTSYYDLSYDDILQRAEREGYVWKGKNPRHTKDFTSLPYYEGPDDAVLQDTSARGLSKGLGVLLENHNLITEVSEGNQDALDDMLRMVKR